MMKKLLETKEENKSEDKEEKIASQIEQKDELL